MEFHKVARFVCKYLYALAASLYLFAFGFFRRKNRDLLSAVCSHFGYGRPPKLSVSPRVPTCEAEEIVDFNAPIRVLQPAHQKGNVSLLELVILAHWVRQSQPRFLFEFGTFDGRTALNLAANSGEEARVYTLDIPKKSLNSTRLPLAERDRPLIDREFVQRRYEGTPLSAKIVQLDGDSASYDFSPYQDRMDFVFVDASHAYSYVLNDTRMAMRLLRSGRGVVVWHDYNNADGVTQALNELYLGDPEFQSLRWVRDTHLAVWRRN